MCYCPVSAPSPPVSVTHARPSTQVDGDTCYCTGAFGRYTAAADTVSATPPVGGGGGGDDDDADLALARQLQAEEDARTAAVIGARAAARRRTETTRHLTSAHMRDR